MSTRLDAGFADVIRSAESQFGVLIPPALESLCRLAFFAGAAEAAVLIECHGVQPIEISAEYRAAFPGSDHMRGDYDRALPTDSAEAGWPKRKQGIGDDSLDR